MVNGELETGKLRWAREAIPRRDGRPHRSRKDGAGQGPDRDRRRSSARGKAARHHDRPRLRACGMGRGPPFLRRRARAREVRAQHARRSRGDGRGAARGGGGRVGHAADTGALRNRSPAGARAGRRGRDQGRPRRAGARRGHRRRRPGAHPRLVSRGRPDRARFVTDRRGPRGPEASPPGPGASGRRGRPPEARRAASPRSRVLDRGVRAGRDRKPRLRHDRAGPGASSAAGGPSRPGSSRRGARPGSGGGPGGRAGQRESRGRRAFGSLTRKDTRDAERLRGDGAPDCARAPAGRGAARPFRGPLLPSPFFFGEPRQDPPPRGNGSRSRRVGSRAAAPLAPDCRGAGRPVRPAPAVARRDDRRGSGSGSPRGR